MSRFLDTLAERVIIYDGAMGTNIQSYQLSAEDYGGQATEGCNEYLVLTKPSVIEDAPNAAAAIGPTISAIACALLAMPKPVPRRSRGTCVAISVLVAGIIIACTSEKMEKSTM